MTAPNIAWRRSATLPLAVMLAAAFAVGCDRPGAPSASAPPSGTPRVSAPPSSTPTPQPSPEPSTEDRCLDTYPGAIADAAFLPGTFGAEQADLCYRVRPARPGEEDWPAEDHLPQVCASGTLPSEALVADRRGGHRLWNSSSTPGETSTAVYDHTVTRYAGTGARGYLADLRAAVNRCGAYTRDGARYEYSVVSAPKLGDESLRLVLHRRYLQPQEATPREARYLIAVIRRGDHVAVVFDHGWEGTPTRDRAIIDVFTQAAHLLPTP
ncbi:hypothetical protein [Catellatospora sichuanensis]|uniref:hypothetical protein n=1 Tax=Catellatospora sichuanensis TaxID=1969805 RepID=UPI001181DEC9|nr:hypothetical protein [Catellatospora sichuanensis]